MPSALRRTAAVGLAHVALAAALLGPMAPQAAAAGPVCAADTTNGVLCVSELTVTPSTVSNTRDTPVTVRVTFSAGAPTCPEVTFAGTPFALPNGRTGVMPPLTKVAGTSATWTSTGTFTAGLATGDFYQVNISDCRGGRFIYGEALKAAGWGTVTVTGTTDTTPPTVGTVTVPTRTLDATNAAARFPVSVTASDAGSGVGSIWVTAEPVTVPPNLPWGLAAKPASAALTLTSGTIGNGTWTGTLVVPAGTSTVWRLSVGAMDRLSGSTMVDDGALRARGLPDTVTTRTTAAPATPTGLKAVSSTETVGITVYSVVTITGTQPAGKPQATDWVVTANPNCGDQISTDVGRFRVTKSPPGFPTWCTYTVRAANAVGSSPPVTLRAFI